ncbi:unnamed protein product [Rotaria sp. Silwood1]|nr:unnamed protein product [Rotaria sp. Silwood1]CAF1183135.1 unnamed protein product [Rotaria sp. Silwood1]CAF3436413.1 unnamed protein product [Rotaria sp. Silwood1]
MFKAAILLSHQYNMTVDGEFIGWQIMETRGDVIDSLSNTCLAVSNEKIVGIVGPVYSREAHIIAPFANKIGIPAISYAATDPDLSDRVTYPAFYRTVPSDNTAALSIAQLFIKFNWTSCIIIYQNDAFGYGGVKAIKQTFNNNGLKVRRTVPFDISKLDIQGNLKESLISSSARIVILWAQSTYTSLILQSALDFDVLGPHFTWILSSSVPLKLFNRTFYEKLIGMLTIQPTVGDVLSKPINRTLLNAAYHIWEQYESTSFFGSPQINNYALFAFDATWSLIQSLQQLCSTSVNNNSSCMSFIRSSFCFDSRFLNSNAYFNRIIGTEFLGVSGPIQFSTNVTNRINGTYYLAQNVQPSINSVVYVPVLEWSDTDNWREFKGSNAIVWPGNSLVTPNGRARLSNVILRIGVTESIPFTIISSTIDEYGQRQTNLVGYVPDLINLLQNKMGFIPHIILAPSNQTYSGLVDAVANGVYDIVVADVTITAARRQKAGFSNSIFDNSLRIIMRKKMVNKVDLIAYLAPFSFSLWMMLLITSIFAAFLICLLERFENRSLRNRSLISAITMSWWYSVGTIMGYGADFQVTTAAGRLLTIGLYLLSLVLVATYTANLASDLTISKAKDIISGIDDIKNGKIPFNRIGVRIGTAGEEYYLREISGGNKNFYPLNSRQHMYDSLLNNLIDASFMDSGTAQYVTNNIYCNLTLVGSDFDESSLAIVIPKRWLYEQDLDVNILSLRESGILDDLKRKWFQISSCSGTSDIPAGMAMDTMSGLFLTFAVISALSLLFFLWTKRFTMKAYLFKLAGCNYSLFEKSTSMVKFTSETSERSQHSQLASSERMFF